MEEPESSYNSFAIVRTDPHTKYQLTKKGLALCLKEMADEDANPFASPSDVNPFAVSIQEITADACVYFFPVLMYTCLLGQTDRLA